MQPLHSAYSPAKVYEKEQVSYTGNTTSYVPSYTQQQQTPPPITSSYSYVDQRPSNDNEAYKFQNYSEILGNYGHNPGLEGSRQEITKKSGFQPVEEIHVKNNEPASHIVYEQKNYGLGVGDNNNNYNYNTSSLEFYSNYNKPMEMGGGVNQEIGGYNQQHYVIDQTHNKKPSLYDNVSFANEFMDTRTQESKLQHEELKKKSSITELKKSLVNSGKRIVN